MHTEIQNSFSFWGTSSPDPYRGFAPGPHWGTSVPRPPAQDVPPYSLFVHVRLLRVLNKDQSINQSINFVPGLRPLAASMGLLRVLCESNMATTTFCSPHFNLPIPQI